MKQYFLYLLKKNLLPLACLALFCVVMYVVPISAQSYTYWNNYNFAEHTKEIWSPRPTLYYGNISTALGIISVLIPIYIFSYKMNKRSVDMYYALPLNKTKILVANFLMGLILMYASYSVAYLWGFITVAIKVRRLYLINYLYLYLASLIPAFITYSVTSFIFTRANTIIDGIICVGGTMCLLAMVIGMTDELGYLGWAKIWVGAVDFFPFNPLAYANNFFGTAIITENVRFWFSNPNYLDEDVCTLINGILWTLIAIASTIGLILTEKHSKAENCGQISKSIFCYKVQIPAYTVMMVASFMGDIVTLFAIAFGVYVLSVIYKRTFKIGWKFAIVLGACAVGGILLCLISDAIIPPPIIIY